MSIEVPLVLLSVLLRTCIKVLNNTLSVDENTSRTHREHISVVILLERVIRVFSAFSLTVSVSLSLSLSHT